MNYLDLLATFVFALVGGRVAADRRMDYGGILFISAVAAITGGTMRNVFLGSQPIWIQNYRFLIAIGLAFLITITLKTTKPIGKFLLGMDTFGLAVATVSGTQIAIYLGAPKYSAVILGVITATAGGLLRDILCQVEPVLLHRETIGTSSLLGALAYVLLLPTSWSSQVIGLIAGATVCLARGVSIYFDLHLPRIKRA
jgi:uncharacterized membrane protein YeiH